MSKIISYFILSMTKLISPKIIKNHNESSLKIT